jgi:transcriptional regulator
MYIPKKYLGSDRQKAIDFINQFNFGLMTTVSDDKPIATHLPFTIEKRGEKLILTSHFSRANEQKEQLESKNILVVFSEPHAYISPKHYEKKENVPTWNYIAVHIYGKAQIITAQTAVFDLLEKMIQKHDKDYLKQWNSLSMDYKTRLSKGIVAFEIEVTELQFNEKLSQNKTDNERQKIVENLSQSEDTNATILATYMNKKINKKS